LQTGTDCATTAPVAWTANALATTVTRSGLPVLTEGATYYACVRVNDVATNVSASACSNGQVIKTLPPAAPATVKDGLAADATWTTSAATLSANWSTVVDVTGITRYDACFSTDPAGADCATTALVAWSNNALATTTTKAGLPLVTGTKYYSCARAVDGVGNAGAGKCSNGITVDTVLPPAPATVNDGAAADATWLASTTTVSANWSAVSEAAPGSGLSHYDACATTDPTGSDCSTTAVAPWASTGASAASTRAGLTLTSGTMYFTCVRAVDIAGNVGIAVACSNGATVDVTPPTSVTPVNDGLGADQTFVNSNTTLSANWTAASDLTSGLLRYDACFTLSSTGINCAGGAVAPWASTGTTPSVTRAGLPTLTEGGKYYACVRALDAAGNIASTVCSDGQIIKTAAPTPPAWVHDGTGADVAFTGSATTLSANWANAVDVTGITNYDYCFSTSATGADCATTALVSWTSNALLTTVTRTGLPLTVGQMYYACVRDTDGLGTLGTTARWLEWPDH